ncbi:CPBP family intramembrane glutamic endopeptidase [Sphingomonas sp. Leaf412]|uniref:CPBP family intramembrane glutamic endopeptidase n=1 Tax=Sphingomonas sp. Leaf412 TaxID=1736370 RepID=UPI001F35E39E|nr:CPBP family intramembrane glutamic endopeptidase [Sphingomonas sp. Leaf412]
MAKAWTAFGAGSLTLLAASGQVRAIVDLPPPFAAARTVVVTWFGAIDPIGPMGLAALGGVLLGGLVAAALERRGRKVGLGDVERVLPRSRAELRWAAALAVTAGITEELFFRLLLPLLIAAVTGCAVAGFAVACVLFGLAHRYQGPAGVVATMAVGALLTIVYLSTGSLWAAMALHAAIDLNAVVLRPIVSGRVSS